MPSTIPCPHCDQEAERLVGHKTTQTQTFSVDQEDDRPISLERLDNLIAQLNQEDMAELFHRINNVKATTRHLPLEVLSTIFQFACPPIDFGTPSELLTDQHSQRERYKEVHFQITLGAVSYHWRQVAWATPQLWASAFIGVHETSGENSVALLKLYFENSRNHPMTVKLDFTARLPRLQKVPAHPEVLEEFTLLVESIKCLIFDNATKIRTFITIGLQAEWNFLICKDLLQCECIELYWGPRSSPSPSYIRQWRNERGLLNLAKLPNLRHFCATDPAYTPFILPWSKITTLHLFYVAVNKVIESLIKCPNLIEFESRGLDSLSAWSTTPSFNQTVTLKHLESLTWCTHTSVWNSAFLRHMRFSKLRILRWRVSPYQDYTSEGFLNNLATFFLSLPETLQVLELDHNWDRYQIMKRIFTSVPQLPELILKASQGTSYSWHSLAMNMIGRPAARLVEGTTTLVPPSSVTDSNRSEGPKILPHLRKLTLSLGSGSSMGRDTDLVIVEMLEALHSARVTQGRFCFEMMQTPTNNTWSPEVLARLKQLAESGFEFEILLGSRRLDYLSHSADTACS